LIEGDPFCLDI